MKSTHRPIALFNTAMTLLTAYIALDVQSDKDMVIIFGLITVGFGVFTLVSWIEYWQDNKLGELK